MSRRLRVLAWGASLIGAAAGAWLFFRGLRWIHPGLSLAVFGLVVCGACLFVAVQLLMHEVKQ